MNCLDSTTRSRVISCLIEGCSIRATVRMTGVAKNTVVTSMIVGASRPEQVEKNVGLLEEKPPKEVMASLDAMATAPIV